MGKVETPFRRLRKPKFHSNLYKMVSADRTRRLDINNKEFNVHQQMRHLLPFSFLAICRKLVVNRFVGAALFDVLAFALFPWRNRRVLEGNGLDGKRGVLPCDLLINRFVTKIILRPLLNETWSLEEKEEEMR